MSNPTAIGAVTATFNQLLSDVTEDSTLSGATVSNLPLDVARPANEQGRLLNLFLYEVTPNAAWLNTELPVRDGAGARIGQSVLAIDLHYLLTAYGESDDALDAHHLLGHAMSVIHDHPAFTADDIAAALSVDQGRHQFLGETDLANQVDRVRINPHALSAEEISRLWTAFNTSYRLSVAYSASVVLIERIKPRRAAPPPQSAGVRANAVPPMPAITDLSPATAAAGMAVRVSGSGFRSEQTVVRIGGLAPLSVTPRSDSTLEFAVPSGLPLGPVSLQVAVSRHANGGTLVPAGASNTVSLWVAPAVVSPPTAVARGATLTLTAEPAYAAGLPAAVILGDQSIPVSAAATALSVTVPSTLAPASYPLRVEMGGVPSLLSVDADPASPTHGQLVPRVEVT